jgi:hypothetical protein
MSRQVASEADFIEFLDVGNHAAPGQRPSGLLQENAVLILI